MCPLSIKAHPNQCAVWLKRIWSLFSCRIHQRTGLTTDVLLKGFDKRISDPMDTPLLFLCLILVGFSSAFFPISWCLCLTVITFIFEYEYEIPLFQFSLCFFFFSELIPSHPLYLSPAIASVYFPAECGFSFKASAGMRMHPAPLLFSLHPVLHSPPSFLT